MLDSPYYRRGRWGEIVWNAVVHSEGWSVISLADYSGPKGDRAPMMHGENEVILPDFDTSSQGVRVFLECKLKARWMLWRKTNQLQTGIDLRNLSHYREIQRTTGTQVILGMISEETGEMIANVLDGLGEERIGEHEGRPLANWDVKRFWHVTTVNPSQLKRQVYGPDGDVREPPARIAGAKLRELTRFLQPRQPELNLLYYGILARAGKPLP